MPVSDTLADPTAEPNTWKADVLDPWVDDVADTIATLEAGGGAATVIAPGIAGITGDGVADDTAEIAAQITAAGVGGVLEWRKPTSYYKISSSLTPLSGQTWYARNWDSESRAWLRGNFAGPCISHTGTGGSALSYWTLDGLCISGGTGSGSKGISVAEGNYLSIRNVRANQFGDQGLHIAGGVAGQFENLFIDGCCLVRTGRSAFVGAVDIGSHDAILHNIEASCSQTARSADGWLAGIVLRSSNMFMSNCVGEISDVGIVIESGSFVNRIVNTRADLNWGYGWVINGTWNTLTNCHAVRNGRETNDTYDGFLIQDGGNAFNHCLTFGLSGDTNKQRWGFADWAGNTNPNYYDGCRVEEVTQTLLRVGADNRMHVAVPGRVQVASPTTAYTARWMDDVILADASSGAFTVTLPAAAGATGKEYTIKRTSASNNVTVDANASETIDGATTKVLGSQYATIRIVCNGTAWSVLSTSGTVT